MKSLSIYLTAVFDPLNQSNRRYRIGLIVILTDSDDKCHMCWVQLDPLISREILSEHNRIEESDNIHTIDSSLYMENCIEIFSHGKNFESVNELVAINQIHPIRYDTIHIL